MPDIFDQAIQNATSLKPLYRQDRLRAKEVDPTRIRSKEEVKSATFETLVDWEIIDMVVNRRKISEEWRQPTRAIWDMCWNHYKQVYDKTNKESWQSTTFQPATSKVVETIVANLHGAIMGPAMPVEFQARRPEYDELVRGHNEIIQSDFEKSKFKAHWTDFLRTLAICGTAIGKLDYVKQDELVNVKERRKAGIMDSVMQMLNMPREMERTVQKSIRVLDHARFKNVDLYDIYPQPNAPEITKDTWVIEKGKITNRELTAGMNDPDYPLVNVTESLLMSGSSRVVEDPEKSARRLALMEYQIPVHYLDPDKEHELLEYWGQVPIWYIFPELKDDPAQKYNSVPAWIWIVDGTHVVRKQLNPWWDAEPPYVKGVYIRVPGQFYGIGPAELMRFLQIEKNEIRNSRMDNVNIILNKIVAVLKDRVVKGSWERLVSEPGRIWLFEGIDDIRKAVMPIDMPDVTKDSYLSSAEVDQEIQEVTAAVKATIGAGGGEDEAAGGTFRGQLLNKQAATERFMLYARVLEICGLGDAIKKFYGRIYQYKDMEMIKQILGEKRMQRFDLISPQELEKFASLVPIGVLTMENKGVKIAQMMEFTKMWNGAPFFKSLDMARRQWIEMGFPDPDTVLFSDDEMQVYTQTKQQLIGDASGGAFPGKGLVGPDGRELSPGPIAGNVPGPMEGLPRGPLPARGPGVSSIDLTGRPLS